MQILVPRFNSNDDKVTLTEWLVKPGDFVKKGQPIACFETSKAVVEYEAETSGTFYPAYDPVIEVSVGEVIGTIEENRENADKTSEMQHKSDCLSRYGYVGKEKREEFNKSKCKKIGQNVIINGEIIANHLEIGDNSVINGRIEADTVILGKNCSIGRNNDIFVHKFIAGDGFRTAQNVTIDVSGGITRESVFQAGNDCLLCMDAYVNCCRKVILGDRVCLSPRSMVFTHRYWQDVRKGYDAVFREVIFENDSWLGANAVVMPGVTIGEGSIVMAGSTVTDNVPARTLVGGIPAVRLKQIPDKDNLNTDKLAEFIVLRQEYLGKEIEQGGHEYRECLRRFGIREDV